MTAGLDNHRDPLLDGSIAPLATIALTGVLGVLVTVYVGLKALEFVWDGVKRSFNWNE